MLSSLQVLFSLRDGMEVWHFCTAQSMWHLRKMAFDPQPDSHTALCFPACKLWSLHQAVNRQSAWP